MPESRAMVRLRLVGAGLFVKDARRAQRALRELNGEGTRGRGGGGAGGTTGGGGRRGGLGALAGGAAGALGARGGMAGGAAGVAAGVAAGATLRAGWQYNKMIDAQTVSFTTLLGSQKEAASFMQRIQALAFESPILDPQQTGDAARLLIAFGVNAKDALPYVKALGDMSAATGKDISEVMPRGAKALGQIGSKGKLQAEEMNQLAESVGLSRKAIRKELGMTAAEFEATFKPGKNIKAERALPAIIAAMEKQSGGAAARMSKTTAGRMDQLREVFSRKAGEATRPFYDAIGGLAGGAAKALQGLNVAKLSRDVFGWLSENIPKAITMLKGVATQIIAAFAPAMPFVRNVLLPLLKGIAIGVGGLIVGSFKVAIPIIRVIATALGWIGEKARPVRGIIQGVGTVIGFLVGGPILKALTMLPKLGIVFRILAVPVRVAGRMMQGVGKAIGWVIGKFKPLPGIVGSIGGKFRTAFGGLAGFVSGAFNGIKGAIVGGMNWVIGKINWLIRQYNKLPFVNSIGEITPIGGGSARPANGNNSSVRPSTATGGGPTTRSNDLRDQRTGGPRAAAAVAYGGRMNVSIPVVVQQNQRGTWNAVNRQERLELARA